MSWVIYLSLRCIAFIKISGCVKSCRYVHLYHIFSCFKRFQINGAMRSPIFIKRTFWRVAKVRTNTILFTPTSKSHSSLQILEALYTIRLYRINTSISTTYRLPFILLRLLGLPGGVCAGETGRLLLPRLCIKLYWCRSGATACWSSSGEATVKPRDGFEDIIWFATCNESKIISKNE